MRRAPLVLRGTAGRIVADVREPAAPGTGRGTVVLLHGGGQTRHSWSRAAETLAGDGWTAVTYDARGHGDSDWAGGGDYSIARYADDLERVLDQVGGGRPACLAGASLGGMTALMAEARSPGLTERLVLVDITPRPHPDGVARIRQFMTAHLDGFESLEEVAEAVAAYNPGRRRANPEGLQRNVRRGADGRWRWHWDPAILKRGDGPNPLVLPEDAVAAAKSVTVPTLLVAGGASDVVREDEVGEFLTVMPTARAVTLDGAGHMVVGDRNDAFVEAIRAFLDD
ncbi:alpha/beta fold hydrolase [Streptomyces sp. NPDC127091]|uniref:alpha/beta fold hydrolase n=1 Tax=Streptomyces sp. NPDC127091 TaxID=3347134 RepID=UPI0036537FA1